MKTLSKSSTRLALQAVNKNLVCWFSMLVFFLVTNPVLWFVVKIWIIGLFFFEFLFSCSFLFLKSCCADPVNILQAVGKNEEEEFNTGPLSVLMMSVKNNTQVCLFILIIYCTVVLLGLKLFDVFFCSNTYAGSDKLSKQQEASRSCQGIWQALQYGSWKCQRNVDRGVPCFFYLNLVT